MASISDNWVQDVAVGSKVEALNPRVCRTLIPVVEMQVKKILQQADKFRKRGKSPILTGEYNY